ncbi:MAG: hypothetical protein HYX78_10825 [Armatimonadetes bacterium]|nr:hypothetical protein [Armatimonadota bacterium]
MPLVFGRDTDGNLPELAVDSAGRLRLAGGSFLNISTSGEHSIKTTPGILQRVTINTAGSSDSAVELYDNTEGSGTLVATISTATRGTVEFFAACGVGITAVVSGSTVADVTIIFE